MTTEPLPSETVLEPFYPVYYGYLYVAKIGDDYQVVSSDIEGTVANLKQYFGASEIRRCDLAGRDYWK